jgi:hypothetical protein
MAVLSDDGEQHLDICMHEIQRQLPDASAWCEVVLQMNLRELA